MENITENIIGGILTVTPILLFIIKLAATEYVTKFIKELFNCESEKKINLLFNSVLIFVFIIGVYIITMPLMKAEDVPKEIVIEKEIPPQKSEAEVYLEAGEIIYNEVSEGFKKNKQKNDSIIANRAKRLVYQIGEIKDNEESVLSLYEKLIKINTIDSTRIFVFRIKKNEFFIYKDDGYQENQVNEESLGNFKTQIASVEPVVKIIDLMQYCKAKEKIKERKPLKFKKQKIEIGCYYCD